MTENENGARGEPGAADVAQDRTDDPKDAPAWRACQTALLHLADWLPLAAQVLGLALLGLAAWGLIW